MCALAQREKKKENALRMNVNNKYPDLHETQLHTCFHKQKKNHSTVLTDFLSKIPNFLLDWVPVDNDNINWRCGSMTSALNPQACVKCIKTSKLDFYRCKKPTRLHVPQIFFIVCLTIIIISEMFTIGFSDLFFWTSFPGVSH